MTCNTFAFCSCFFLVHKLSLVSVKIPYIGVFQNCNFPGFLRLGFFEQVLHLLRNLILFKKLRYVTLLVTLPLCNTTKTGLLAVHYSLIPWLPRSYVSEKNLYRGFSIPETSDNMCATKVGGEA